MSRTRLGCSRRSTPKELGCCPWGSQERGVWRPSTACASGSRRSSPNFKWPGSTEELTSAVATYLDWIQRFLDYGAGPSVPSAAAKVQLNVATAAPIKATPWRLGAATDGSVSISFLHADRWAHARGYAIRPFGRYQELLIGAGAYYEVSSDRGDAREQLERLVRDKDGTVFKSAIGYGVAVSQRTERIEPPLILGARTLDKSDGTEEWELVVVRHGEESLAFSNRPLFGRLGWHGVALSFERDYRTPAWPDRLRHAIDDADQLAYSLHPPKPVDTGQAAPASAAPAIDGTWPSARLRPISRRSGRARTFIVSAACLITTA